MTTIKKILEPRYEVIAYYPNCPFTVGDILMRVSRSTEAEVLLAKDGILSNAMIAFDEMLKCKANFKYLNWFERRQEKDMPKFVKHNKDGYVHEITRYDFKAKIAVTVTREFLLLNETQPSTLEEYDGIKK